VLLNLPTVDLKLALTAETKSWMVDFGHHCNRKYHMEMEQIFTFIDEASKKLNRHDLLGLYFWQVDEVTFFQ